MLCRHSFSLGLVDRGSERFRSWLLLRRHCCTVGNLTMSLGFYYSKNYFWDFLKLDHFVMFTVFHLPTIPGMLTSRFIENRSKMQIKITSSPCFKVVIPELSCWYKREELWCGGGEEASAIRTTRCGQNLVHWIHTGTHELQQISDEICLHLHDPAKYSPVFLSLLFFVEILDHDFVLVMLYSILIQTTGYCYCLAVPPARSRQDLSLCLSWHSVSHSPRSFSSLFHHLSKLLIHCQCPSW